MDEAKQRKQRRVFAIVFSYLLSVLVFVCGIAVAVQLTICSEGYLRGRILDSGFAAKAAGELKEDFVSFGAAAGFDKELMESFVTEGQLQTEVLEAAARLYSGQSDYASYEEWGTALNDALLQNVTQRGVGITPEIRKGVADMAEVCRQEYAAAVSIPFLSYLAPALLKIQMPVLAGMGAAAVLAAVILLLLWMLLRNRIPFLRYTACAVGASALLCGALPVWMKLTLKPDRLNLKPEALKRLLVSYVDGFEGMLLSVFAVLLAAALACACGYAILRAQRRRKRLPVDSNETHLA